jgi:hypothetical protein
MRLSKGPEGVKGRGEPGIGNLEAAILLFDKGCPARLSLYEA